MSQNFVRTSQHSIRTSQNFIRMSQNFVHTSQHSIRMSQNFIHMSQNFVRTSQHSIRTSQNFIRTSQPLDVRFYWYTIYICTCLILKQMACHTCAHLVDSEGGSVVVMDSSEVIPLTETAECNLSTSEAGVYKHWTGLLEWWNGGLDFSFWFFDYL